VGRAQGPGRAAGPDPVVVPARRRRLGGLARRNRAQRSLGVSVPPRCQARDTCDNSELPTVGRSCAPSSRGMREGQRAGTARGRTRRRTPQHGRCPQPNRQNLRIFRVRTKRKGAKAQRRKKEAQKRGSAEDANASAAQALRALVDENLARSPRLLSHEQRRDSRSADCRFGTTIAGAACRLSQNPWWCVDRGVLKERGRLARGGGIPLRRTMRAGGPRSLWRPPCPVASPGYPPADRGWFRDSLHAAPLRSPEGHAQLRIGSFARKGHGATQVSSPRAPGRGTWGVSVERGKGPRPAVR